MVGSDTNDGVNIWTKAVRLQSCLRTTVNILNTPPGDLAAASLVSGGIRHNGAFGSNHTDGANFVFADGHVSYVNDNINLQTYQELSKISKDFVLGGSF